MQITIQGIGITVTEALSDFIHEKFKKFDKKSEFITSVSVTLTVEKLDHIAKADIALVGTNIHAQANAQSMYPAIDALIDKIDRQLVKHKEKIKE